jgi:hypothetical protein
VTRLPSETNGAGLLRDTFGRRELTVRNLNDPLNPGDVPGVGTVFDADGREQVVIAGQSGTTLALDQLGGTRLVNPVVPAGLTYRDVNKDGFYYVQNFDDQSGTNSPLTYFKGWGARGTKSGAGNLDMFWGSVTHKGSGEAGLFIGDITADAAGAGGNLWGFDVVLIDNKNAQMYGGRLALNPTVARAGKVGVGLQIENQNDAIQLDQGIRIFGNWNRPFIAYSDAAGTAIIWDLDNTGKTRSSHAFPMSNGTKDLGDVSNRWRSAYVNNLLLNAGDAASGGGVVALHNAATLPTATPASGGVLYAEAGALKWKGSSGTVTIVAPA